MNDATRTARLYRARNEDYATARRQCAALVSEELVSDALRDGDGELTIVPTERDSDLLCFVTESTGLLIANASPSYGVDADPEFFITSIIIPTKQLPTLRAILERCPPKEATHV